MKPTNKEPARVRRVMSVLGVDMPLAASTLDLTVLHSSPLPSTRYYISIAISSETITRQQQWQIYSMSQT